MEDRKKRFGLRALMLALLGIFPLTNAIRNPRLASAHGADMMQLVAAGFCFGVAFASLMLRIKVVRSE
jgi:hypothetical protein